MIGFGFCCFCFSWQRSRVGACYTSLLRYGTTVVVQYDTCLPVPVALPAATAIISTTNEYYIERTVVPAGERD